MMTLNLQSKDGKVCTKCKVWKAVSEFYPDIRRKDKLCSECKSCNIARTIAFKREHREESNKYSNEYKQRNPEKTAAILKKCALVRNYGITIDLYNQMLVAQGGVCAMFEFCGSTEPGGVGTWHVDHEHFPEEVWKVMSPEEKRKYVRGLLCHTCNSARVSANTLESARAVVKYLESFQKVQ